VISFKSFPTLDILLAIYQLVAPLIIYLQTCAYSYDRKGIRPVKKLDVGLLVVTI